MAEILFHSKKFDVIATQEMGVSGGTKSPFCPGNGAYRMVWKPGSRAAVFMHRRFETLRWEIQSGKDWASVTIFFEEGPVTFLSVYVEQRVHGERWQSALDDLASRPRPQGQIVFMGDMNLHSPLWDEYERSSPGVDRLINLTTRWELYLLTQKGTPTRLGVERRNGRERDSTIDHIWVSTRLAAEFRGPLAAGSSDHAPQTATVRIGVGEIPNRFLGYKWRDFDKVSVEKMSAVYRIPEETDLLTSKAVDGEWLRLSTALQNIAAKLVDKKTIPKGRWAEWWTKEVRQAVSDARKAERRWRAQRTQLHLDEFEEALTRKRRTIDYAKARTWRNFTQAVSVHQEGPKAFWALERWARLRSHIPPDPPRIPDLVADGERARTHNEKADFLAAQFFPCTTSSGFDPSTPWRTDIDQPEQSFWMVTEKDVTSILAKTGSWKSPGVDYLPAGFIKACHSNIKKAIARLSSASLRLAVFPACFKRGSVTVLRKPGKTLDELEEPGGWRPITLLCHLGKILEAIFAERLTNLAEASLWLPEAQMGNRKGRSTELAVRIVTDMVTEVWRRKGVASMLLLDLKGAFDRVNHHALLRTLFDKGVPNSLIRFVESFLRDRESRLVFDNRESGWYKVPSGVPQGSPLSPILFVIFIATLYDELAEVSGASVIGFADDTNILAYGRSTVKTVELLNKAWTVCETWADKRGMSFSPKKTKLIHFARQGKRPKTGIRLGDILRPAEDHVRFLGVWLDRRLRWKAHGDQIVEKMKTQKNALTRIAAKVWGVNFARAREVFTKCLRPAMTYGAPAWHQPTEPGEGPRGVATRLSKIQNQCLRVVTGAFRATPIRDLETESLCPPIDLVLNERVAKFEAKLEGSPTHLHIISEVHKMDRVLMRRRGRGRPRKLAEPSPMHTDERSRWLQRWQGEHSSPQDALGQEWRARWEKKQRKAVRGRPRTPTDDPFFDDTALLLHSGLSKAESSALVQARTEKIGLRGFLFTMKVPDISTPLCECGTSRERLVHLALYCPIERDRFASIFPDITTAEELRTALSTPTRTKQLAQWILSLKRLSMYRLYRRILETNKELGEVVPTLRPPKQKKKKKKKKGGTQANPRQGEPGISLKST